MGTLFDLWSFIIQGINFLVIALVLRKFFFIPYMKYLNDESLKRADLEARLLDSAEIVNNAHKEADIIIKDARHEAKNMTSTLLENAKWEAAEIINKANIDAENVRLKGMTDIDIERKEMTDTLKKKVLDIAIRLNQKLFGNNEANVDFLKKNTASIEL